LSNSEEEGVRNMNSDKKFLYLGGLGALAVVLLLTGASPVILLLLACPVMMMFMMHGMDHGNMDHGNMKHGMEHDKEK